MRDFNYYKNHFYLTGKNQGYCKKLSGVVFVYCYFVDDAVSKWDNRSKEEAKQAIKTSCDFLNQVGRNLNRNLNVYTGFEDGAFRFPYNFDESRYDYQAVKKTVFKSFDTYDYIAKGLVKGTSCDEFAVIFLFNKPLRSSAMMDQSYYSKRAEEIVYLGRDPNYNNFFVPTFIHELLHLFGAVDLYFPIRVKQLAEYYLPGSVMNNHYIQNCNIDPLTLCLVGLLDYFDDRACAFLDSTRDLTYDEWFKGRF